MRRSTVADGLADVAPSSPMRRAWTAGRNAARQAVDLERILVCQPGRPDRLAALETEYDWDSSDPPQYAAFLVGYAVGVCDVARTERGADGWRTDLGLRLMAVCLEKAHDEHEIEIAGPETEESSGD